MRLGQLAQLGDRAGDGLHVERITKKPGDFNNVLRRSPLGEDVLGDLLIDPGPPLPAAVLAGEIVRGNERE